MLLAHAVCDTMADPIRALGFRRRQADTFTADGMTMTARDGWLILEAAGPPAANAPRGDLLGSPGLWKPAAGGSGAPAHVCAVPLAALLERLGEGTDDELDTADSIDALVRWMLQTRPGAEMRPWEPPAADRIDTILPAAALSLNCGPYLAQVGIVAEPGRLALRVPICRAGQPPAAARRQWLDRLLDDARSLRLVRVGLRDFEDGSFTLESEADLSGAPKGVAEAALPVALDALRACFSLLAVTAAVICDPQPGSRALDETPDELLKPFDTRSFNPRSKRT